MTKLAIAVRLDRCVGCHTCVIACKMQNNVADGTFWNRVVVAGAEGLDSAVSPEGALGLDEAVGVYPDLTRTYVPIACQHCENAACLAACPTGATYRDDLGRIEIDYEKCIGCQACIMACPYGVRTYDAEAGGRVSEADYGDAPARPAGVVEKCTLCRELTDAGETPMCVRCCPTRARVFGDLDDPESEIAHLRAGEGVHVLLEDAGTQPQVFYLA